MPAPCSTSAPPLHDELDFSGIDAFVSDNSHHATIDTRIYQAHLAGTEINQTFSKPNRGLHFATSLMCDITEVSLQINSLKQIVLR
jgi:hypothetical protein